MDFQTATAESDPVVRAHVASLRAVFILATPSRAVHASMPLISDPASGGLSHRCVLAPSKHLRHEGKSLSSAVSRCFYFSTR